MASRIICVPPTLLELTYEGRTGEETGYDWIKLEANNKIAGFSVQLNVPLKRAFLWISISINIDDSAVIRESVFLSSPEDAFPAEDYYPSTIQPPIQINKILFNESDAFREILNYIVR
jgi:hypothetical protein